LSASSETGEVVDFLVNRRDWQQCRFSSSPLPRPREGQVLFRVDRFAFTANNVTYAVVGDMLGYWNFFPAEAPWGRLPVMGFADVLLSAHPEIAEGERVFGFFPMSTHLLIEAAGVQASHFLDGAAHRGDTALAYRQYLRTTRDSLYDAAQEDGILLLRGLFMTSFLVDDFLADNRDFGAHTFVISSASSKTAIALAFLLSARRAGRVVGLTSARNLDFVARLGCYDQVLPYGDVAALPAGEPSVFVDHAGDGAVVNAVHHHLRDNLRHSCVVGATHWGSARPAQDLPGPAPTFFFAPTQSEKRNAEWGPAGFQQRLGEAWKRFLVFSGSWLRVVQGRGSAEVERVYREVLQGHAEPSEGHVLSLWVGGGPAVGP
jgi:hypothetical protein